MEVIDKIILLLYDYKNTGDRATLIEALHFTEKLADVSIKPKEFKNWVILTCSNCKEVYHNATKNSKICPECAAKLRHIAFTQRIERLKK